MKRLGFLSGALASLGVASARWVPELDDTAYIQRLIDKAAAAGGGIVRLPAGRWVIRSLALPAGVQLFIGAP
jgi:polygalacturonase